MPQAGAASGGGSLTATGAHVEATIGFCELQLDTLLQTSAVLAQAGRQFHCPARTKAQPIGRFSFSNVEQICCKLGGSFTATGTNVEGTVGQEVIVCCGIS